MKRPYVWILGMLSSGLVGGCVTSDFRPVLNSAAGDPVRGKFLVNVDSNGVALEGGYDPVAFFTENRPVRGNPTHQSAYRGAIYYFASAGNKAAFDANPARYEPQFGGFCGYAASINRVSPISVEFFEILDGRLVLQHNRKAWNLWHQDIDGNLARADRNWPELANRFGK